MESFLIGENLLERIRTTVKRVEGMPYGSAPVNLTPRIESVPGKKNPVVLRICEFTGAWNKHEDKVVTLKYAASGSTQTISVTNALFNLDAKDQTALRTCVAGKDGTAWHFVSAGNMPPCESMAGKEISPVGYSSGTDTAEIAEGDSAAPASLFLAAGCVEWVKATAVTFITNLTMSGGDLVAEKKQAWVFAKVGTVAPSYISVSGTNVTAVVTSIALESGNLVAKKINIFALKSDPDPASDEIETTECPPEPPEEPPPE